MAVVEKTVDILGDDGVCKFIIERKLTEGMPVDFYDEAVKNLRSYALRGMQGLQSIDLPNVTDVGSYALAYCPDLKRISLSKCTRFSGNYVFRDCSELESVDFPLLQTVYEASFAGCNKLASISLPSLVSSGSSLFGSMGALVSASIPRLTTLPSYAFNNCRSIRQIDLPSVTTIREAVMGICPLLEVVTIGPNITTIHSYAFSGTPDGMIINLPVAEGAISGAPWGAPNAIINYDTPYAGTVPIPES